MEENGVGNFENVNYAEYDIEIKPTKLIKERAICQHLAKDLVTCLINISGSAKSWIEENIKYMQTS